MDGVAELIANNGVSAAGEESFPKPSRSMVKRGALLGATLFFLVSLLFVLAVAREPFSGEPAAVLVLNFFIWLALMAIIGVSGYVKRLFTRIFSEEEPSPSKKIAHPRGPVLPAAYSAPVADSGQQIVDTAKIGKPSSITEQTTSRLNNV
jgi:hypothetical protein